MKIPNADQAIIAPEKLRDYLLNTDHKRGGSKARLLLSFGYSAEAWQVLEADLRTCHLTADVRAMKENPYGRRFKIRGPMKPPGGRTIVMESVWQIDTGTEAPRFITMYPR